MDFAFMLKKIVSGAIMPLSITLIILVIGLIFLDNNSYRKAKIFLTTGILALLIIAYQPFSNALLSPLETNYSKLTNIPNDVKHILLLGGDVDSRGWEALRLYNKIDDAKIITSGYKGNFDTPEALRTAHLFYELGIPLEDIIVHPQPKDTKEEVLKMKELLADKPFILVTSAYHMTRAMAMFQKEGLNPIAAPTAFTIENTKFSSVQKGSNLLKTEIALHEYIGLIWAKLKGHI